MGYYWVTFADGKRGTVEGDEPKGGYYSKQAEADARKRAEELGLGEVVSIEKLPYPASPQLDVRSGCPSFCHSPRQCCGRSSCPQPYACSE